MSQPRGFEPTPSRHPIVIGHHNCLQSRFTFSMMSRKTLFSITAARKQIFEICNKFKSKLKCFLKNSRKLHLWPVFDVWKQNKRIKKDWAEFFKQNVSLAAPVPSFGTNKNMDGAQDVEFSKSHNWAETFRDCLVHYPDLPFSNFSSIDRSTFHFMKPGTVSLGNFRKWEL